MILSLKDKRGGTENTEPMGQMSTKKETIDLNPKSQSSEFH